MPEVRPRNLAGQLGTVMAGVAADVTAGAGQIPTQMRLVTATANAASSVLAGGAAQGLVSILGTNTTSPVVPAPVDAATIADGLWIVQGFATVLYTGGVGNVQARLTTSGGAPLSDWYVSGATGASPGVYVPAHFAVFGNADAVRLQFEALPDTGTVDEMQGQITGYLVGTSPT